MMATFTDHPGGDIFASGADLLVCPVNCVPGVMGKGLALAFKERFKSLEAAHWMACQTGALRPGVVPAAGRVVGHGVLFFPTKRHWRDPARLEDVQAGMAYMAKRLGPPFRSIAIPALGCGLGGLAWVDVRPLIVEALADLPLRVMLFPPHEVAP